ncbi:NAD(P)/FAD-dependent oxidoreductase [Roseomonas elaeocarpi]|uniref:NAD(P)/FAD-dependent oxidoreductase n=1 Tax=Roseomonas elaeocarpi TaxID=907779 RepID=A0ABV6K1B2_9PROT
MTIFTEDFSTEPWWWQGFRPPEAAGGELPARAGTLVIGAGYAGTACALRLAEAGEDVVVLEAGALGQGASTRSGGQVSGGVNVGKSASRQPIPAHRKAALLRDAAAGFTLFETLLERHGIRCGYHRTGRVNGLWSPAHAAGWAKRLPELNEHARSEARLIDRDEVRAELGTSFYHGGVAIDRAGHVQPAEFYGGLLQAAQRAGARFIGTTPVRRLTCLPAGFRAETSRGTVTADRVVFATNAYTAEVARGLEPALRRGLVPVTTHMIATEEMPEDLARTVLPTNRGVSETRRVISHYRLSPDGRRLLFGGRASFFPLEERRTAAMLHRAMVARFPQLAGLRISNSWGGRVAMTLDRLPHIGGGEGRYFVAGCQGSGVTMMTYLGHSLAEKILRGSAEPVNSYDDGLPPHHPLYDGTPWFMPALGSWYQFLDRRERVAA